MSKGRLEAFSDGVIAILITIMVLELKVPHTADLAALWAMLPVFLSYLLSYVFLGIYWNNHHHTLHAVQRVNGNILWANLHLLFWLSLVPFATSWMGENRFAALPTAFYGMDMLASAVAFTILVRTIIAEHGADSLLAQAVGRDNKSKLSLLCYASSIPLAYVRPGLSQALFVFVAALWLVPDSRIEAKLKH